MTGAWGHDRSIDLLGASAIELYLTNADRVKRGLSEGMRYG